MNSISQGLVRFKADVGYFPPVLGVSDTPIDDLRRLFVPPTPGSAGYSMAIQQWWSSCAMSEYMVGYGSHWQDGYGIVTGTTPAADAAHDWDKETPALGLRHPGPDGIWGAGTNTIRFRMGGNGGSNVNTAYGRTESTPLPIDMGKIFGPYVEMKDERLLAAISGYNGTDPILHFPGDTGYNDLLPKVIVDYWGMPIRYYRRPYPPGALNQSYRAGTVFSPSGQPLDVPTLSDVYVLRPWELPPRGDVTGLPDGVGDTGTTHALNTAEFALFSYGPDKHSDDGVRRDDQPADPHSKSYNKDNLIEVGP
jgi:hypothetical protein